ncbi:MAG: sulfotransferase [Burkholderiales bacterium]|nr:sulfotransferase [Burkholderiales bacterium]
MRYLDLSGFLFSGKSALHDFVSEIDGIWTPGYSREFDLIRVKDGLADLESALASWSPIRADAAARRFLDRVRKLAAPARGPGRLLAPGFGYGERFPGLAPLAERFIERITVRRWRMHWPYHLLDMTPFEMVLFKLRRRFLGDSENLDFRLVSGERFREALREFLDAVLTRDVDAARYHTVVLNNAFEPYDPERFAAYFEDARSIVVDRDPRDMFVEANRYSRGFNEDVRTYRRISGAFDVDVFIDRIRTCRRQIRSGDSPRVLRLRFEDLVENYEATASRIYAFLGVDPASHSRRRSAFDPARSEGNVGLWKTFADQAAIRRIEDALLR